MNTPSMPNQNPKKSMKTIKIKVTVNRKINTDDECEKTSSDRNKTLLDSPHQILDNSLKGSHKIKAFNLF